MVYKNILITGSAGFIGAALTKKLADSDKNLRLICIDDINDFYSIDLKFARLQELGFNRDYIERVGICESNTINAIFYKTSINDKSYLEAIIKKYEVDVIYNLAAQANVRYSLENPQEFANSNLLGFFNILDLTRICNIKHLIFASSSSVYGTNKVPFDENQVIENYKSFYAATKYCNEVMAKTYSELYDIKITGLRFFTVYGEWGRPDMATMLFIKNIFEDKPIKIHNNGEMERDFTYIQDLFPALLNVLTAKIPQFRIYNLGTNKTIKLMDYIKLIENEIGIEAKKEFVPAIKGESLITYSNIDRARTELMHDPKTSYQEGIKNTVKWYKQFINLK
ncbi:MAG: NAD-dependent epimerase [Rickettsiales bacterium]|nr:MAG: NAD-dependent epimerase [Rickettsiales bacterium]